jgi:hypothetical protein
MRLVIAVGTLVAFLESEVSFQSCPPFCAELVELMSIGMRSIDAARPCGSNPGIFVAIRDLPPDLSPLLCRVHPVNLDIDGLSPYVSSLRFERWYFYWNWTMGCRYTVRYATHTIAWWGAVSWSISGHFAFQCARSCGSDTCQCRFIGNRQLIVKK